ncbi:MULTISPECIES: TadE/TadG family type IV pilus assembly protein [Streptomyces]|uniref:TadE/TadG family type IV pilus assembly protein n=1 Tax=Streptomyces laculatispora TaxID=887464 RepID=A0ABY9I439_9ACTN|nr:MULTISPECIES: TadE/TadG family type IV pilus assembly protein [Streptomyces]MCX4770182.1 pilus assembly protein [Streptomyces sp. NBC_01285]ROQ82419.1 TadE-like protein [Streptomyces sp. CEV 2-1]WLQ40992.1 TadE/TadG family type IV pilus assembly protein [Streptomyces laculatispora]
MTRTTRRTRRERGQVAIEYLGFVPLLLLVGLFAIQLGVAGYAINQAGTAARVAARTASHDRPERTPEDAGQAAISDWLRNDTDLTPSWGPGQVTYKARIKIPSIVPGLDDGWLGTAERSSTMPRD